MPAFYPVAFIQRWTFTGQSIGGLAADTTSSRVLTAPGALYGSDVVIGVDMDFGGSFVNELYLAKVTANGQITFKEQNPYATANLVVNGITIAIYTTRAGIIVS